MSTKIDPHPSYKEVQLWTDGSGVATEADGPCGCGVVLIQKPWRLHVAYYPGAGTHNVAEIVAILTGLRMLNHSIKILRDSTLDLVFPKVGPDKPPLIIRSDSQWALYSVSGRYNGKKHRKYIDACREEVAVWAPGAVKFEWVRGHSSLFHNETADKLANEARESALSGDAYVRRYVRCDVYREDRLCMTLDRRKDPENLWRLVL